MRPPHPPEPPSPPRKAVADLSNLGGYAVPAIVRLASDSHFPSRLYAAEILVRIGAEGQIATLLQLADEQLPVTVPHGDVVGRSTLAKEVTGWLRSTHPFLRRSSPDPATPFAFEAEEYLRWLDPPLVGV